MSQEKDIEDLKTEMKKMVPMTTFTWVIGVMITLCLVTFGWQSSRITKMEDKVTDTQLASARIETQLSQIQAQLLEIKQDLKGNKTVSSLDK